MVGPIGGYHPSRETESIKPNPPKNFIREVENLIQDMQKGLQSFKELEKDLPNSLKYLENLTQEMKKDYGNALLQLAKDAPPEVREKLLNLDSDLQNANWRGMGGTLSEVISGLRSLIAH